jgi:polyphosphate kinase
VNDAQLRARLKDEILAAYLADTAKTRILEPSGDYRRARPASGKTAFSAQDFFMQLAEARVTADQIPPAVEMGPVGPAPKPAHGRKTPVRKKANRAVARLAPDDAAAAPLS